MSSPANIHAAPVPSLNIGIGLENSQSFLDVGNKIIVGKTDFASIVSGTNNTNDSVDMGDRTKIVHREESEAQQNFQIKEVKEDEDVRLEAQVREDIALDAFDGIDYNELVADILHGKMDSFNKLDKGEQTKFLVKLYRDPEPKSEKVLDLLLPFLKTSLIAFTFRFASFDGLSDAKTLSFLKRLAPENSEIADQLTINFLLASNPSIIAKCSVDTLLALRKKEYLGQKYFERLQAESNGQGLSKTQNQQLSAFSAKIATLCFAYFEESAGKLYERSTKEQTAFTRNDLNEIKGLTKNEKNYIYAGFQEKGLINAAQQPVSQTDTEKIQADIKDILASALAIAEEYESSVKAG